MKTFSTHHEQRFYPTVEESAEQELKAQEDVYRQHARDERYDEYLWDANHDV